MPQKYTSRQKMFGVRRELRWRRRVYPGRVEAGKMSQADADYEIALFEAIEADYETMDRQERTAADLFGEGSRT